MSTEETNISEITWDVSLKVKIVWFQWFVARWREQHHFRWFLQHYYFSRTVILVYVYAGARFTAYMYLNSVVHFIIARTTAFYKKNRTMLSFVGAASELLVENCICNSFFFQSKHLRQLLKWCLPLLVYVAILFLHNVESTWVVVCTKK